MTAFTVGPVAAVDAPAFGPRAVGTGTAVRGRNSCGQSGITTRRGQLHLHFCEVGLNKESCRSSRRTRVLQSVLRSLQQQPSKLEASTLKTDMYFRLRRPVYCATVSLYLSLLSVLLYDCIAVRYAFCVVRMGYLWDLCQSRSVVETEINNE